MTIMSKSNAKSNVNVNSDINITSDYQLVHGMEAPESMTMDRFEQLDELVVAQTTNMCLRQGCCRPSINWVLLDSSNYELTPSSAGGVGVAATNPFELPSVGGWIHEEATFFQRCFFQGLGCRKTRFVHHAGLPPISLGNENFHCFRIQGGPTSSFLTPEELNSNIVAIHQKESTCSTNCCCFPNSLPYLKTMDSQGRYLGETRYVCDGCIWVPKFLVLDKNQAPKFLLRPDTCWMGLCPRPRCGGTKGKCCRLPFLIRDPVTLEPLEASTSTRDGEETAQITQLWSGLANEVCFKRHAYHVAFPTSSPSRTTGSGTLSSCSVEDKLVLIGSAVLIDVALFESDDDK